MRDRLGQFRRGHARVQGKGRERARSSVSCRVMSAANVTSARSRWPSSSPAQTVPNRSSLL
ncbi:hypothetical protein [Mameliella alba]|uniref:hypothetical protein n=1 Tax=Mameliella alba TaxID=561184 RepID=UPI0020952957|nr:hypothetical protein [Mameliella alba]